MIIAPVLDRVKVYGAIILGAILVCLAGYGLVEFAQPVHAKSSDPVCMPFASVGTFEVYRCTDEQNGNVIYINTVGMMAVEP